MRASCFFLTILLSLGLVSQTYAQSFNIAIGTFGSGPPSPSFGGAAAQVGGWDEIYGAARGPLALDGLDGLPTSVQYSTTGGIGNTGYRNFAGNTGDFSLLLNQFAELEGPNYSAAYHFAGLQPGAYRVYTYSVEPSNLSWDEHVAVPGAVQGLQHVTGPMPGNSFIQGITHSIHDIKVSSGNLEIDISGPPHHTYCNGIQLVAVPEPTGSSVILPGLLFVIALKKRFRPAFGPRR